jgi:hypothetical protein
MRAIRRFFLFACGGGTVSAGIAGLWWLVALLVVVYLLTTLRVNRLFLLGTSILRAGLRITVPIAPLTGAPIDSTKARRHVETAVMMLNVAVRERQIVDLMLCSGYRVIGWQRNPGWLFQTLSQAQPTRRMRVLILDPDSQSAQERALRVMQGRGHAPYRAGTEAVLWTLKQWRSMHGFDIEVRLYQEEPIWQMVLLHGELWLMSAANQTPTDLSPLWVFRRDYPYGIANGLEAVFERRWSHPTNRQVIWNDIGEPNTADVVDLSQGWE